MQVDSQKFTRNNPDVQPFEPGGEAPLEFFCTKSNCSLFALGSHSKKRPHNLVLGRLYDFHLYDALEFGIEQLQLIKEFRGGAGSQVGNKVSFLTGFIHSIAVSHFSWCSGNESGTIRFGEGPQQTWS